MFCRQVKYILASNELSSAAERYGSITGAYGGSPAAAGRVPDTSAADIMATRRAPLLPAAPPVSVPPPPPPPPPPVPPVPPPPPLDPGSSSRRSCSARS